MSESEWSRAIVKVDPVELRAWLAEHGPNRKEELEAVAASTGRDNYGLVGKVGKRAKSHDAGKWKRFQESVKV